MNDDCPVGSKGRPLLSAALAMTIVLILAGGGASSLAAPESSVSSVANDQPGARTAAERMASVSEVVARNDDCSVIVYQAGTDGARIDAVLAASAAFAAAQPQSGSLLRKLLCQVPGSHRTVVGSNGAATPGPQNPMPFRECDRNYPRQVNLEARVAWPIGEVGAAPVEPAPGEPRQEIRSLLAGTASFDDDKVEYCGSAWSLWTGAAETLPLRISVGSAWNVEGRDIRVVDPPTERLVLPPGGSEFSSSEPLLVWNFHCENSALCCAEFAGIVFEGSMPRSILVDVQGSFQLEGGTWYSQGAFADRELNA